MNESDFEGRIKMRACEVVDALEGLTPYERALVLHQAEIMWSELETLTPAQLADREAQDDADAVLAAWMGAVLQRLGPVAAKRLIGLARDLDNEARLERMM